LLWADRDAMHVSPEMIAENFSESAINWGLSSSNAEDYLGYETD
jgi:hypothetical protein